MEPGCGDPSPRLSVFSLQAFLDRASLAARAAVASLAGQFIVMLPASRPSSAASSGNTVPASHGKAGRAWNELCRKRVS